MQLGQGQVQNGNANKVPILAAGGLLVLFGLRRPLGRLLFLAAGGGLIYRGITGRWNFANRLVKGLPLPDISGAKKPVQVEKSVTVNRPPEEVYRFWRNLENLPRFMKHVESVTTTGDRRSHWVVKAPIGGARLEWDSEITEDQPGEVIAWRSLPNSSVDNSGRVMFQPAPGERGTQIRVNMQYSPPGGVAGAAFAKLMNQVTAARVAEDIHNFKAVLEAGEVPTTEGQTSGRLATGALPRETGERQRARARKDAVQVASEHSFPASDPPGWASGREEG